MIQHSFQGIDPINLLREDPEQILKKNRQK